MKRMVSLLIVVIAALWAMPLTAAGASPVSSSVHAADNDNASVYEAPENDTAPERGLRIKGYPNITYDAVDLRSDGTLSRLSEPGPRATYDYDDTPPLVQGDDVVSTNTEPVGSTDGDLSLLEPLGVAANSGKTLARYDPDFALGQITQGGRASASQLDEFGSAQGWLRSQSATGPVKYTDSSGIVRLTIKGGSPRAPGSGGPHVELRNAAGVRVDPYGIPVTRKSLGNHTSIDWDW